MPFLLLLLALGAQADPGETQALAMLPPVSKLKTCTDEPEGNLVEWAKARTVHVNSGDVSGSGVVVSPDGFVLTAAHLLGPQPPELVFLDGTHQETQVARVSLFSDLALLRIDPSDESSPSPLACAPLQLEQEAVGSDVLVVGSPGGEALSHTVSKGIVSAYRSDEGHTILQTDASISPGNSGGPIFSEGGRVLAIVSFKVVGDGMEGLGFGVATTDVPRDLSIELADHTEASLQTATASLDVHRFDRLPEVVPGPGVTIDTSARYEVAYKPRIGLMIGGASALLLGAVIAQKTYAPYDEALRDQTEINPGRWKGLVVGNALGWVTMGGGAAMVGLSFRPSPNGRIHKRSEP